MAVRKLLGQEASALWGNGKGLSLIAVATTWGLLVGTRMIYRENKASASGRDPEGEADT
ncbi:hypothetical protein G6M89_10800 [Natronolimnobius sp. AArcel1]|uniref:hypothetical protein n=1 Tax=Natronolimnobius sp. AArcel1 TaxID=1679093 RepID=UPI0013ED1293|nr:hypothetical protein [Natronolimnobius sp. AArcel1]NGM69488.1 hypothetical protein [Natronolimnobius sp. AArcel1]